MNTDTLARAVAKIMYDEDNCSRALGMEVLEVKPGFAKLS